MDTVLGEIPWDSLSDEEWNNKLDERISLFNKNRGNIKVPAAPHIPMDNEYERGINNKYVTDDLIRHYADAIGDVNPLFRDPGYAAGTRWGGIVAPPTFESAIAKGTSFGGKMRIPGVATVAAGNKHEYFRHFRHGDSFSIYDKYEGFVEKTVTDKPYRMFVESMPRYYVDQGENVVAINTVRTIYLATPPGKRGPKKRDVNTKGEKTRYHFSKEELDAIHQSYDEQLDGVGRRGAEVRYWEDVVEGEELRPIAKGPYDVCDASARTVVSCYPYAFAVKWAAMRKHLQHHPIDPETGEYRFRRDWHYEDHVAKLIGAPLAFAAGAHNEMMLCHAMTDWMGDDGFVREIECQDRRMNFLGDMTWVKGRVARKFEQNGERLVDLEVWGENQEGVVHTKANAIIKLVSRGD